MTKREVANLIDRIFQAQNDYDSGNENMPPPDDMDSYVESMKEYCANQAIQWLSEKGIKIEG